MFVKVITDLPVKQIKIPYDYIVPKHFKTIIKVGMRIVVNFNGQNRLGYVIEILKTSTEATKEVLYVLDKEPTLTKEQLQLINYIKENSFCSYESAFRAVVPHNLTAKYEKILRVQDESQLSSYFKSLIKDGTINIDEISEEKFDKLSLYLKKGILNKENKLIFKDKIKQIKLLRVVNDDVTNIKEIEIIKRLIKPDLETTLIKEGYSKRLINKLINSNNLEYKLVSQNVVLKNYLSIKKDAIKLTNAHNNVLNNIEKNVLNRYLLTGKAGSGKSTLYLELIKRIIDEKSQVVILVPEKTLIPLIASRLKLYFDDNYTVYDNELTNREKLIIYNKVKNGDINIILGTSTAIFLPFKNLKLIVLDEAHDYSYINNFVPFYDVRNLSYELAKMFKIPLLFVTATPSIDMVYQSKLGLIKKLELPDLRHFKPFIDIIDMKNELLRGNNSIFSESLKYELNKTINNNKQAIILVNKKGYAPFIMCRGCGKVPVCPHCNTSLTYYKDKNILRCNYCNYNEPFVVTCDSCKREMLKPVGFGLEHVHEEIVKEFKNAKVLLLESSEVTKKGMTNKILEMFNNNEANILLGTSMVSKGHDYKNVNLVAVLLADQMLKINNYLANELTYQLIIQHIGRIRGNIQGKALIQAYNINHFVLDSIKHDNFNAFYKEEISIRKTLKYSPFYHVVKATFKGGNETKLFKELRNLSNYLVSNNTQINVIGPSEEYELYKKGIYTFSLIIKAPIRYDIMALLKYIEKRFENDNVLINIYNKSL